MENKSYNGYSSYETWAVALWIDNEERSQRMVQSMAQEAYDGAEPDKYFTREDEAKNTLATALKEWIEEQNPLANNADMFSDLLNAALSEVNWRELAENYLEDVDKTEETEV